MKCPKCQSDNPDSSRFCCSCAAPLTKDGPLPPSLTKTFASSDQALTKRSLIAGKYEIIEEIGRGGMGIVFKAEDIKLKRPVALKFLPPQWVSDPEARERFIQEARAASALDHPNICNIYEIGEAEDDRMFIAMAFYEGESLREKIQSGPLEQKEALSIAIHAAAGMAKAHQKGIVHRDIKPANILVTDDGVAKIVDFGVAKLAGQVKLTREGTTVGTVAYMSPEQARGEAVDQRSDIWSLGVVLYEMLSGVLPFKGDFEQTMIHSILQREPERLAKLRKDLPAGLENIIFKAMAKRPSDRYQTMDGLLEDLRLIAEGLKPLKAGSRAFRGSILGVRKAFAFPAMAVVVLAGAALIISRFVFKAAPAERSIAVISFQNITGDVAYDYLRKAVPTLLITSLEQSKYLKVTTFERLRDLLRQQGKAEVEVIDGDLGFELCRLDNVEVLVLGSYIKAGETFATDVKIYEVKSRKLIRSFTAQGVGAQSILDKQIALLSREISRGVGLSKQAVSESATLMAQMPTRSIEAYRFYLSGHEKLEKMFFNEARKDLEKAVELDPQFALAYFDLRGTLFPLGDLPAARQALAKAKELSARAPEKDRLYIEAQWTSSMEGDFEKRFRILQEIAAKYPKEKDIHLSLSAAYMAKGMLPEAFAEAEKGLALDPRWIAMLNTLGYVHLRSGNPAKAEEVFKKAIALAPDEPNAIDSLGELYYLTGRLDEAIDAYKRVLGVKPDHGSEEIIAYIKAVKGDYREALGWIDQFILMARTEDQKGRGYWWKAVFNHISGRRAQAQAEMERYKRFSEAGGSESLVALANALYGKAVLCFDSGAYGDAVRSLAQGQRVILDMYHSTKAAPVIEALVSFERDLMGGFVAVKEGQGEVARQKIKAAKTAWPQSERARLGRDDVLEEALTRLEAEALVLEGEPAEAIVLMEKQPELTIPRFGQSPYLAIALIANFPLAQDVVPRAYEKLGDIGKAIEAYKKLVTFDPKDADRRMHNPLYHFRLAKLYDAQGRGDLAVAEYGKLLEAWQDADPAIPELKEAKLRLGFSR